MKRALSVILFISLATGGCIFKTKPVAAPPQNEIVESKIDSKLKSDPLTAPWQIHTKVEGNRVTLTGLVDQQQERQRAEELARLVVGELRQVDNQLMLTNEVILDNSIVAKLKTELITDPATRQTNIGVKSNKGVVVLEGQVQSPEQKRQAENLAINIAGVSKVENKLKVQGKG